MCVCVSGWRMYVHDLMGMQCIYGLRLPFLSPVSVYTTMTVPVGNAFNCFTLNDAKHDNIFMTRVSFNDRCPFRSWESNLGIWTQVQQSDLLPFCSLFNLSRVDGILHLQVPKWLKHCTVHIMQNTLGNTQMSAYLKMHLKLYACMQFSLGIHFILKKL